MASTSHIFTTPLFSETNFEYWRIKMEAHLQSLCCLDCIESDFIESNANELTAMTAAQRKQYEELKQKQGKVIFCILNALDDSIFPKISGAKTSKQCGIFLKSLIKETKK